MAGDTLSGLVFQILAAAYATPVNTEAIQQLVARLPAATSAVPTAPTPAQMNSPNLSTQISGPSTAAAPTQQVSQRLHTEIGTLKQRVAELQKHNKNQKGSLNGLHTNLEKLTPEVKQLKSKNADHLATIKKLEGQLIDGGEWRRWAVDEISWLKSNNRGLEATNKTLCDQLKEAGMKPRRETTNGLFSNEIFMATNRAPQHGSENPKASATNWQLRSSDGVEPRPQDPRMRSAPTVPPFASPLGSAAQGFGALGFLQPLGEKTQSGASTNRQSSRPTVKPDERRELFSGFVAKSPTAAAVAQQIKPAAQEASQTTEPPKNIAEDNDELSEVHRQGVEARLEAQRQARLKGLPQLADTRPSIGGRETQSAGAPPSAAQGSNQEPFGHRGEDKKRAASEAIDTPAQKRIKAEDSSAATNISTRLSQPVCNHCRELKLLCNHAAKCWSCCSHMLTCIYEPCPYGVDCKDSGCTLIHSDQWDVSDQYFWYINGVTTFPEGTEDAGAEAAEAPTTIQEVDNALPISNENGIDGDTEPGEIPEQKSIFPPALLKYDDSDNE